MLYHIVYEWQNVDNPSQGGKSSYQIMRPNIKNYEDFNNLTKIMKNIIKAEHDIKNLEFVITNIIRLD